MILVIILGLLALFSLISILLGTTNPAGRTRALDRRQVPHAVRRPLNAPASVDSLPRPEAPDTSGASLRFRPRPGRVAQALPVARGAPARAPASDPAGRAPRGR